MHSKRPDEPDAGALNAAVQRLRDPRAIRERCARVLAAARAGQAAHFTVDDARLPEVAGRVAALTRRRFPDLRVPLHSRWRHFAAGGVDRAAALDARLAGRDASEAARARIELALVSVLLDAGAGPRWRYREAGTGAAFARSEGLAVASLHAFMAGLFSSAAGDPCRVDAAGLRRLDAAALARAFQADDEHPLVGLDGRVALLHRLADALRERPDWFTGDGRPGRLFDLLAPVPPAPQELPAPRILGALLDAFSGIWPAGSRLHGVPVGDCWPHPAAGGDGPDAGWLPLHKLSQWLSYSLVEPFEAAGVRVTGLDGLTGLPEYRNGGLLLDGGVLVPRDAGFAAVTRTPADPWVVEWRALTVALLDELAREVRVQLGAPELPLCCVLEGGTWAAGREIAAERRADGAPPVTLDSDGTVF